MGGISRLISIISCAWRVLKKFGSSKRTMQHYPRGRTGISSRMMCARLTQDPGFAGNCEIHDFRLLRISTITAYDVHTARFPG